MPFRRLPFDPDTLYADVRMMGVEGFGAVYLIDDERKALVETGTSNDVGAILSAIGAFGLRPADVDHLIVSHVHLDHAGGAGFLLESMPNATVHVHERGAKHLADPSKLVASAGAALRGTASEFGTMRPIRADRLVPVGEGATLDLGGRVLRFLDSPGHAPHELTILDESNGCVYTGDACGLYFAADDLLIPITPAPSFDLVQNLAVFRRLAEMEPRALLFSHFGPHEHPPEALRKQLIQYPAWSELVGRRRKLAPEEALVEELYDLSCSSARKTDPEFLRRRVRNSVNGLIAYHERMERAPGVR